MAWDRWPGSGEGGGGWAYVRVLDNIGSASGCDACIVEWSWRRRSSDRGRRLIGDGELEAVMVVEGACHGGKETLVRHCRRGSAVGGRDKGCQATTDMD
ncbi:uncharacterized protein M6B38_356980 [Iris pallida]|uniref:Uncharacterized protein n=1 Tax=Iris pallida TaxID=29817 RepID=A0AAX6GLM2_IRIPA|nr:uncharacterized protein M6B38_356980 [Iris pallida]